MSDMTKRPVNAGAEARLFAPVNAGACTVELIDYMGGDAQIAEAARCSYGKGTKTVSDDETLIRTLVREAHCYRGDMEVLTAEGWKRWDALEDEENFLIPNPASRTLSKERLQVKMFDGNHDMVVFSNNRMSFAVNDHHRMWFKGKYSKDFAIFEASKMPRWGHFDPLQGYIYMEDCPPDPRMELVGFFLGDGTGASTNRITFHLKKLRKIEYIEHLLGQVEVEWRKQPSHTHAEGWLYTVHKPDYFDDFVDVSLRSKEKKLKVSPDGLSSAEARGILAGLIESDGHRRKDRDQIQFCSSSPDLLRLFETLSSFTGCDAHQGSSLMNMFKGSCTSLEARAGYFSEQKMTGRVYCATSSTGLLMVRGGPDKFAFVCGNTSPLEMCELKFSLAMPIFTARQWIRQRTASLNEYSARYSVLEKEFYLPKPHELAPQSAMNKQGREGGYDEAAAGTVLAEFRTIHDLAYGAYERLIDQNGLNLARETARAVLPSSIMTRLFWKIDLHNLLHFLALRCDPHAQLEIRQGADAIDGIVADGWPVTREAHMNYVREAVTISRDQMGILRRALGGLGVDPTSLDLSAIASQRERKAFAGVLGDLFGATGGVA